MINVTLNMISRVNRVDELVGWPLDFLELHCHGSYIPLPQKDVKNVFNFNLTNLG
jgi:hypothetical protein